MNVAFEACEVDRFRNTVARRLGLQFDDAKLGFLGDLLRRRLGAHGDACESYFRNLEAGTSQNEWSALVQELTVPETYFFRNMDQFRAFSEVVLPCRLQARESIRRLRFLSAACASGEEAYSLAILLREVSADPSWVVSILGIDINPAMLEKAAHARYSSWALRETPLDVQRRWFRAEGREMVLDDMIHFSVNFRLHNLVEDDPEVWQPEAYDAIFCRNVIMYFTEEASKKVVAHLNRALAPGGFLFLGHAETLRGLSHDFHLHHTHGTFYYQRKEGADQPTKRFSTGMVTTSTLVAAPLAAIVDEANTWVGAICSATERIRALAEAPIGSSLPGRSIPISRAEPGWNLRVPLDLMRTEHFAEALGVVQSLPPESAHDPDALLLQAVLLALSGRLAPAEEVCRRLLTIDELNSGAHYVLALCREGARDQPAAASHDQVAVYLDPAFAMPRLHLGLLARRAGDSDTARRELGQALALLQREDASRLLLFGGGFNREALLGLCRAELIACGGKP
jgi:chemotaxis protein methyltransferase CheR